MKYYPPPMEGVTTTLSITMLDKNGLLTQTPKVKLRFEEGETQLELVVELEWFDRIKEIAIKKIQQMLGQMEDKSNYTPGEPCLCYRCKEPIKGGAMVYRINEFYYCEKCYTEIEPMIIE